MTPQPLLSIVVPVYKNAASIDALLVALEDLVPHLDGALECVFVVDGSPDDSAARLAEGLTAVAFQSHLVAHARNFGAFAAIRTGLGIATGRFVAVMAADLQEPPELMLGFVERLLAGDAQVVVGQRMSRSGDRRLDRGASSIYWALYRRFVMPSVPAGGIDVFACTASVRDQLLELRESHSSLVGLLLWLGHPYVTVPYERRQRSDGGRSAWTMRRKVRYMSDSVFSFTDLPLRVVRAIGLIGLLFSLIAALIVSIAWWRGSIDVAGYTPLILVMLISTMLIVSALGIVGSYVWRAFENSKARPASVVASVERFG